jgi:hypothetical protein
MSLSTVIIINAILGAAVAYGIVFMLALALRNGGSGSSADLRYLEHRKDGRIAA